MGALVARDYYRFAFVSSPHKTSRDAAIYAFTRAGALAQTNLRCIMNNSRDGLARARSNPNKRRDVELLVARAECVSGIVHFPSATFAGDCAERNFRSFQCRDVVMISE